jgi:hypothetical protein
MLGFGNSNIKVLIIFNDAIPIGKIAEKMKLDVTYINQDNTNMMSWNYKRWSEENKFYPDIIYASPPSNTFSTLAYALKERDTKTGLPKSDRAKEATELVHNLLDAIRYFKGKNKNMAFIIDNPRGMLKLDNRIKNIRFSSSTLYCHYNDNRYKPTDFFSNFNLNLIPVKPTCEYKTRWTTETPRGLPITLITDILNKAIHYVKRKK